MPTLGAVVPCFEEADHLESTLSELRRVLDGSMPDSWELIVVVSAASRDGTLELARRMAATDARIRVVLQPANDPGYGRAIALGIAAARSEWLLLMDGDGQFDPSELPAFLDASRTHDAVLGIRRDRQDSIARRMAGRLYSAVARRVAGVRVADVDCGFKLLRASIVRGVRLRARTGAVNAELLSAATRAGAHIAEIPVRHLPRKGGHARFETGRLKLPRAGEALAIGRDLAGIAMRRQSKPPAA